MGQQKKLWKSGHLGSSSSIEEVPIPLPEPQFLHLQDEGLGLELLQTERQYTLMAWSLNVSHTDLCWTCVEDKKRI